MMRISAKLILPAIVLVIVMFASCEKETENETRGRVRFPETFEMGTKTDFAAADVVFYSGSWNLDNVTIASSSNDAKNGNQSLLAQGIANITMNFDLPNGASEVSFYYAKYSSDANSTLELWASTNGGTSWGKVDGITASATSLTKASFNISYYGYVRFQLRKTGAGRLNVDDFSVTDYNINEAGTSPTRDNNMGMGNPSSAAVDANTPDNYLVVKSQYALSYNNSTGTANWVSWHLSSAWKGGALRCDCFTTDSTLPSGFYKATTFDYINTGFDRGHLTPSEDRDSTDVDNAATFLMTNIMPQAPNLNQNTWATLETYSRTLMNAGNELYIIAGGYGSGGSGANGGTTTSLANGKINVPSNYWKVIVVLKVGPNDVSRVNTSTRVIAVNMPNTQTVSGQPWGTYRTSVDAIEAATGYDILSEVPVAVQAVLEAQVDNGPTQ